MRRARSSEGASSLPDYSAAPVVRDAISRLKVCDVQLHSEVMKTLFLFSVVALLSAGAAQSTNEAHDSSVEIQNPLIGAWKLVSLEQPGADRHAREEDCTGMFIFTRDGKASVQVMYRNVQTGNGYANGGYEASYGSYHIDSSSTFTFHVDGALVRNLIGRDLKRLYEISGNRLTVKPTDPDEHWKVVWERY